MHITLTVMFIVMFTAFAQLNKTFTFGSCFVPHIVNNAFSKSDSSAACSGLSASEGAEAK